MNNCPIGVFDSGIGGLSVWNAIRERLPEESVIYYGDGKNCPYGPKSREQITAYAVDAVERLLSLGAKMIVVACNTATAAAIDTLRSKYKLPVVGMEPAVKPAALATKSGVVGILATHGSLDGRLYKRTSARYAGSVKIISTVGEGFVELVESGHAHTPEAVETVRHIIEPILEQGADQLVLGCTHYPFLTEAIRKVVGDRNVNIIDPSPAVAKRVESLLDEFDLRAERGHKATYDFCSASSNDYVERLRCMSESLNK